MPSGDIVTPYKTSATSIVARLWVTIINWVFFINNKDIASPYKEIKDYKEAMKFLENYRWSSFLDYIGKKNFPSLTSRKFLLKFWGGEKEYQKETKKWLRERDQCIKKIKELTLE